MGLQPTPERARLAIEKLLTDNRITVSQGLGSRDVNIEGTAVRARFSAQLSDLESDSPDSMRQRGRDGRRPVELTDQPTRTELLLTVPRRLEA